MTKIPNFELDSSAISDYIQICWICKHRAKCPMEWECETLENLDHDYTDNGVDEA